MKTAAVRKLRARLATDEPTYGLWVTLESPSLTEMAVGLGLDWLVIDAEHGHLDWKEIVEHVRAAVRSDTVVLVRVAEHSSGLIKRALDIGADGVIVPWVESADQLRRVVAFARYPPEGVRGIGAERATAWGQALVEHTAEANEHVLVVPILETAATAGAVVALAQVEGVELFFFGPADWSSTAGFRGQWEGPGVAAEILAAKNVLRQAGKHCGILATGPEDLARRREQGFRVLGLGTDAGLFLRGLGAVLAAAGLQRRLSSSQTPTTAGAPRPVLDRPPESFRPDRLEVMNSVGSRPAAELAPGIHFECLVGSHNKARKLTTGLVTFAPGSCLSYHTHPFTESITLVSGCVQVEVEGRCYALAPLDNVVIGPGLAHQAQALSASGPTLLHIAMGTEAPSRTLVPGDFPRQSMSADSCGSPGAERVTQFRQAPRGQAGPGTEFVDYFNKDSVAGIEMSGGYGRFTSGGRLPAHVHDFDESITIIEGTAVCVVEGRRYALSGGATALVPRGRVHYFVNESDAPMGMIWVYAGPTPERIVVAEQCATAEGDPWR